VWIPGASFTDELRAVATELGWQDATPVEEHVVHDLGLHAGVARIGFLRRRPELSREEFARHWIDVHGPLVLAHDPLFVRYVANVVTAPDSAVDGIVEQYFPDAATWAEHDRRILEERPAVSADIQTFLGGMEQLVATPLATAGG
jgi:hypothetical protein